MKIDYSISSLLMTSTSWKHSVSTNSDAVIDELLTTQHSIILELKKSDHRQLRCKENADRQVAGFSKSVYQKLWYKSHTTEIPISHSTKGALSDELPKEDHDDSFAPDRLDTVQKGLRPFYAPLDEISSAVCDICKGFRKVERDSEDLPILPTPWTEHHLDGTNDTYYYNADSGQVCWTPPAGTNPVGLVVFKETKSVLKVCRCALSLDRRLQLLQKFEDHARETIRMRREKQTRMLNGALHALVHNIASN
uniref:Uncharacterized protein AlNc14C21G2206 n=1 Tax=Albugo laibachii Nc14 TaxID=890382 RepID=F0W5P1_9STRA|nr:conserved hypothetical protein [Albugo laibachii Nc14]|eukprot:CCA16432.1 conserved hypothetical protein [Albugo laibachii Nc14]